MARPVLQDVTFAFGSLGDGNTLVDCNGVSCGLMIPDRRAGDL